MSKKFVALAELQTLRERLPGIPRERLGLLGRMVEEERVRRGQVLYYPGRPSRHVYCVLEGAVGLCLIGGEGRRLRLEILTQGKFFGVSALVPEWHRVSMAVALQESRLGKIQAQALVEKIYGMSWRAFTSITGTLLRPLLVVSLRRAMFLLEDLPNRLALELWENASHPEAVKAGGLLSPVLTQEELAAMVGASRPRVSLALRELERRGFIVREGRRLRVHKAPLGLYLKREFESLMQAQE